MLGFLGVSNAHFIVSFLLKNICILQKKKKDNYLFVLVSMCNSKLTFGKPHNHIGSNNKWFGDKQFSTATFCSYFVPFDLAEE